MDIGKHLDANNPDDKNATWNAAEEFLKKELGFCTEEITEMGIKDVSRLRKVDSNTVYVTLKDPEKAS